MKSPVKLLFAVLVAASVSLVACNSGSETKSEAKSDSTNRPLAAGEKIIYQCPMHPEEKSDKSGKCSKCGMDLEKVIVKDTIN